MEVRRLKCICVPVRQNIEKWDVETKEAVGSLVPLHPVCALEVRKLHFSRTADLRQEMSVLHEGGPNTQI